MKHHVELKMDIEEFIPILIYSEGNDMDSLLENAEYSVDVPDPKKFNSIYNLSLHSYNRVVELFEDHLAGQAEMAREAKEDR